MKEIITLNCYTLQQFPQLTDYEQVAELLRQDIMASANILAASFIGSYTTVHHSRLSGLDIALAYKGSVTMLPKSLARSLRVARERNVQVNILPITSSDKVDRRGPIDPASLAAIERFEGYGGAIKGCLSDYCFSNGQAESVVLSYISGTLNELVNEYLDYKNLPLEQRSQALTRTLYGVIYAARLICFAAGFGAQQSFGTNKAELVRIFSQRSSRWCTHWLETLVSFDQEYDKIIDRDSVDPTMYSNLRKKIQEAMPGSIEFLQRNLAV